MAFKLRSSGPFKMMGSSPVYNGQKTEGKIKKKTFIGPTKPMIDKDNDGIPAGIDMKDSPGGKQSNPPKQNVKPVSNKKTVNNNKKTVNKKSKIVDPRTLPYDDGKNKGTLRGITQFKSNTNKVISGDGVDLLKTTIKNKAKKAYNYFTKK